MGVVVAALFFNVAEVAAQNGPQCTYENWDTPVGASKLTVGTQGLNNRRYAGPCGLRVELDGTEAYVPDNTPAGETTFNVRFYFFLNDVTSDVTLFQAENSNNIPVITATYDRSENDVSVVFANAGTAQVVKAPNVSSGWNSLEIQWAASSDAEPKVTLGSAAAVTGSAAIDTSNFVIDVAKLGAIGTVPGSGSIDFDDYDSRRGGTAPGRLLVADVNGDGVRRGGDITALINTLLGTAEAEGQPDCNEDGRVTGGDITCLINLLLAN